MKYFIAGLIGDERRNLTCCSILLGYFYILACTLNLALYIFLHLLFTQGLITYGIIYNSENNRETNQKFGNCNCRIEAKDSKSRI